MGVEKQHAVRGGKMIIFRKGGGGINIVFGPKYRPLKSLVTERNESSGFSNKK